MINKSTQKQLLAKILQSDEFSNSNTYSSYLTYLVESAEVGKCLKEVTIAIEFFGKDPNFNPAEDTTVRSHMYTLRKKLQNYYLKEGKDDNYRLKVPKGHYMAQFVEVSSDESTSGTFFHWILDHYYIFIILILIGVIFLLGIKNHDYKRAIGTYKIVEKDDPIWKDYIQSDLPVLISVGDHLFFTDQIEKYGSRVTVRHGKVNSPEDLEDLKKRLNDENIRQADEPYFPHHSIWSLPPILAMLYAYGQTPIMHKSSSIGPQLLGEDNILYLGSIKTLYVFRHVLNKSHFSYEILPHKVTYTPPDSEDVQVFQTSLHSNGPNEDLVLAVKLPGPANNSIFIIASYHSLGTPEVVNYLINGETRQFVEDKFTEKYGEVPQYFEILFKVTGIDKVAYETEMLVYNKIP
ncbi:MAG: hypothetical protein JXQ65_06755 [Candidatus Marinimicrobia bacterium]|nr:hypothetical protein [Candidatus Neomarinimicrobiota bacterium]